MQRDYIFGVYPERSRRGGRRIAWRDSSSNVYYYLADAIGSTRAVTDATGNTCFEPDYYPYGQENDYVTSCSPTYKFAGYEYDSETGNYYAYARYYDPRLGRFLSADPLNGGLPTAAPGDGRKRRTPGRVTDQRGTTSQLAGVFPFTTAPLAVGLPASVAGPRASNRCPAAGAAGEGLPEGHTSAAAPNTAAGPLNPQSLNRYTYALNDPTTLRDPTGQLSCATRCAIELGVCLMACGGPEDLPCAFACAVADYYCSRGCAGSPRPPILPPPPPAPPWDF